MSSAVVSLEDAKRVHGLRAVFGEVYPDPVRMLAIGPSIADMLNAPQNARWMDYSVEFCGGTHVNNTKQAQAFVILEETAVAKGTRRIIGTTGQAAVDALLRSEQMAKQVQQLAAQVQQADRATLAALNGLDASCITLREQLDEGQFVQSTISKLRKDLEGLQKTLYSMKNKVLTAMVDVVIDSCLVNVQQLVASGQKSAVLMLPIGSNAKAVKKALEAIKHAAPSLSFLCISDDLSNGKASVFAYVTDVAQVSGLSAAKWVSATVAEYGGRGGGKTNMAQGSVASSDEAMLGKLKATAQDFLQAKAQKS